MSFAERGVLVNRMSSAFAHQHGAQSSDASDEVAPFHAAERGRKRREGRVASCM
jgi:hypothetical protein